MTILEDPTTASHHEQDDPTALFEEAHRRRRRRRWAITGIAIVVLLVSVVVITNSGGSGHRTPTAEHGHGAAGGSSGQNRVRATRPSAALINASAMDIGVLGGGSIGLKVGWAINDTGVYLTTNAGRTWRNIAPVTLGSDPSREISGNLVAVNRNDLWLPIDSVEGGDAIERTTDGGRHWESSPVTGCPTGCSIRSLSFVNVSDGFALVGPDSQKAFHLLHTVDGGVTWQATALPPYIFSTATSIRFTTADQGWAVTGAADLIRTPAMGTGTLWHTTDGGLTWVREAHLPDDLHYRLPIFFGARRGVVLGFGGDGRTAVFVTTNGGRTWQAHKVPADPNLNDYRGYALPYQFLPFSAASTSTWAIFVGPTLYSTSDGGRHWDHLATSPAWSPGNVQALYIGLNGRGWALGNDPPTTCSTTPGGETPSNPKHKCKQWLGTGPTTLLSTSDGGHLWRPLPFSRST
jgi:photosystem II stability/assembly factor-like uncharacterized protein